MSRFQGLFPLRISDITVQESECTAIRTTGFPQKAQDRRSLRPLAGNEERRRTGVPSDLLPVRKAQDRRSLRPAAGPQGAGPAFPPTCCRSKQPLPPHTPPHKKENRSA
ncbi:hypothetical protein [Kamptonema formosum]|uniref:hypothetical protein n=1 Tax=Kamptonema formosum TaxID=331992 RepID=UPI0012DE17FD|nr:hypothetical protein [Oscillatoria sp. PCC 10802]